MKIDATGRTEEIRREITEAASPKKSFFLMNGLATVVACYGLLMNSTAVVIGAMIIALLLGPITGIALALVDGDRQLLKTALLTEVGGAALVLGIAMIIGTIHPTIPFRSEILSRTSPNILDLLVALAGGAAGAYAAITPRISSGLVGVAIATALVPPLATCGLCLARGELRIGFGGFVLYFTNLIAIQVASSTVLALKGYHKILNPNEDGHSILKRNWVSLVALGALMVTLGLNLNQSVTKQRWEALLRSQLVQALKPYEQAQLADFHYQEEMNEVDVFAVVYNTGSFTPEQVGDIEANLRLPTEKRVNLHLQAVLVKETTRDGYAPLSPGSDLPLTPGSGAPTQAGAETPASSGPDDPIPSTSDNTTAPNADNAAPSTSDNAAP